MVQSERRDRPVLRLKKSESPLIFLPCPTLGSAANSSRTSHGSHLGFGVSGRPPRGYGRYQVVSLVRHVPGSLLGEEHRTHEAREVFLQQYIRLVLMVDLKSSHAPVSLEDTLEGLVGPAGSGRVAPPLVSHTYIFFIHVNFFTSKFFFFFLENVRFY